MLIFSTSPIACNESNFKFLLSLVVVCPKLNSPTNGSMVGDTRVYNSVINFACENGYKSNGSAVRRCQANGTWSGQALTCTRK